MSSPASGPPPALAQRITANVAQVRARIARAARRTGRDPAGVTLVAVSKTFGAECVRAGAAAGVTDFGENRVQEALQKIDATAELQIRWHLVGHLQSNKARRAAQAFTWIHSVDSLDLLRRVEAAALEQGAAPQLLVQVDLAGEASKYGAPMAEVRRLFEAAAGCRAARLCGLMVLPPWTDDPEAARPFFRRLVALREALRQEGLPEPMLRHLSMGMSHDLEVAVEEGATLVRIGTAIFGPRTP